MLVLPNCPQPQGHVRRNISSMSNFHGQTDNMRCRLELYYVEQHGIVVRDGGCLLLSRNMRIFMTKTSILPSPTTTVARIMHKAYNPFHFGPIVASAE